MSSRRAGRGIECTAFVEAANHSAAARKIAAAVAALEYGSTAEAVLERIYNVTSGIELIAEGISTDYRQCPRRRA
jgi:hypothetical protein